MYSVVNHIFTRLDATDATLASIKKSMAKQKRFNRKITVLAIMALSYVIANEIKTYELKTKFDELSEKVESLKCMKGA